MKRLLLACSMLFSLSACQVGDVAPVSADRYQACEMGYSCAVSCEMPMNELQMLGCGPGDFTSEPPFCQLEDDCANAKTNCFESCEANFPASEAGTPQEQVDCKISCNDDFGNDSSCKDEFKLWLDERDEVLRPYRNCLSPCEGRPSRVQCDSADDPRCDPVLFARHMGVEMVEACTLGDDDACAWRCDDPQFGFPTLD